MHTIVVKHGQSPNSNNNYLRRLGIGWGRARTHRQPEDSMSFPHSPGTFKYSATNYWDGSIGGVPDTRPELQVPPGPSSLPPPP